MSEAKEQVVATISDFYNEHPEWEQKEIIAAAYKKCGVSKSDFQDGFCPYNILNKMKYIQGLQSDLYSNDFSELPTSIRIAEAVNHHLPGLRSDFPKKEEIELLKLAYDLARNVLDESDFEVVTEDPIFFQIFIEDIDLFEAELKRIYEDTNDFTDDKQQFFAKDKGVTSSNVAEVGYENGKLRIFFQSGGGYEYPVPSSWYVQMLNAPSKGAYVWDTLRGRVPGRVIDNPKKITPGGVGGSIVPYFKIKGAAMPPDAMRKSVKGFLKASRKGRAKVSGVPIRQIPKPEFKSFIKFLEGKAQRFQDEPKRKPKRTFKKISQKVKSAGKKLAAKLSKKKKEKRDPDEQESKESVNASLRAQIKRLVKMLKNASQLGLGDSVRRSIERRLAKLRKQLERKDFLPIIPYNLTDDFVSDMRYFRGPITRAGDFEYGSLLNPNIKTKGKENLTDQFSQYRHLPSFDSHHENQILGFAYNFTDDPDLFMKDHPKYPELLGKDYFFTEGYAFDDIENISEIPIVSDQTELPVSIRFQDANEGIESSEQDISSLVHLAISVNQTEKDRCSSADGAPCWVSFHDKQDFTPNLEHTEGDQMPDDEKEKKDKKEEEPPKGDKGGSKDEKKDKDEKKEKKDDKDKMDFTDDSKITINKSELIAINKLVSDMRSEVDGMKSERKHEKAELQKEELNKIKNDFADKEQAYIIKAEFLTTADFDSMNVLKKALIKHEAAPKPREQLGFGSDFNDKEGSFQKRLENMYGVSNK